MIIALVSLLTLSLFSIARVSLYIIYFRKQNPLPPRSLLFTLRRGLRFDLSIFSTIFALPILLALLPFEFTVFPLYQASIFTLWFLLLTLTLSITVGDLLYFKYVNRHITNELGFLFSEAGMLFKTLLSSYRLPALLAITLFLTTGYLWFHILLSHRALAPFPGYGQSILYFFLTLILLAYFIHGNGFSGKPIAPVDAYSGASRDQATIIMNGLFSAIHSTYRSRKKSFVEIMDSGEAVKTILNASAPHLIVPAPDFPMLGRYLRDTTPLSSKPLNMAMIVIEGFSSHNLPLLFREATSPWAERSVMPFTAGLASDSLLFPNFFANGQRTLDMVHTLLTSIPRVGNSPLIGYGQEFSGVNFNYLPQLLKKAGYTTRCFNGPWEKSIHMDSIASLTGFNSYHHGEEINQNYLKGSGLSQSEVGAWDEHLFDFVYKSLREDETPNFSLIFTATSHAPYQIPERESKPFGVSDDLHKYFNCNRYLDSVMRDFFKKVDGDPHFENTLFFITGDHTIFPLTNGWETTSLFHTPMLIYNKKHITPRMDGRIGSHMDLFPTLLHAAGYTGPMVNFGQSLFSKPENSFSIMSQGDIIHATDGETWMISPDLISVHENFRLRSGYFLEKSQSPCPQALIDLTKSYYQAVNSLFRDNRYYPAILS